MQPWPPWMFVAKFMSGCPPFFILLCVLNQKVWLLEINSAVWKLPSFVIFLQNSMLSTTLGTKCPTWSNKSSTNVTWKCVSRLWWCKRITPLWVERLLLPPLLREHNNFLSTTKTWNSNGETSELNHIDIRILYLSRFGLMAGPLSPWWLWLCSSIL